MYPYYSDNSKFYVAVDSIIFSYEDNKLKVLIQKRKFEPFQGESSLMGGFVREDETITDAARRIIKERTGLDNTELYEVGAFGSLNRDAAARVISICYFTIANRNECDDTLNEENVGQWIDVYEMPQLIFDHNDMVKRALKLLRKKIALEPIAMRMLSESFTLSQLQTLYEVILNDELDKRNFRKRIAEMPFIEETGEIDKKTSKRGARLFRFNDTMYNENKIFKL